MDGRPLEMLPKAHLHLHFTGSLRPSTLLDLAAQSGTRLPDALVDSLSSNRPMQFDTTARGWFRFQRLYDAARAVIRSEAAVRRLVLEAAEDERRDGSGWLEIQVDPTSYAPHLGGLTPALELVLDCARDATDRTGVGVGVIVAASRTRHPLDARTLARLAARYAGQGVVGFGLSNDERRGDTAEFAPAFRIARDAGLASVPHGGELRGADAVAACLDLLGADRIGHGVRSVEDPTLIDRLTELQIPLEICPSSNVALGVFPGPGDVPLRTLMTAGVPIALGADDPLLFGPRLLAQYEEARSVHELSDPELARLASESVRASRAPDATKEHLLRAISTWLATPPE